MSAQATFWAWDLALKSSLKLVLLCLADNHNEDTNQCNPSVAYIADKTGLDKKTVPTAISKLEEMNVLSVNKRVGRSTQYQLNLYDDTLPKNGVAQKRVYPKTGKPNNGGGVTPKTGKPPYPKTGDEPKSEPKKNLNNILEGLPDGCDVKLFKDYVSMRKKMKKPMTDNAIERQIARLNNFANQGHDVNEILILATDRNWMDTYAPSNKQSGGNCDIDDSNTDW